MIKRIFLLVDLLCPVKVQSHHLISLDDTLHSQKIEVQETIEKNTDKILENSVEDSEIDKIITCTINKYNENNFMPFFADKLQA